MKFFTRKRAIWGLVAMIVVGGIGYKVFGRTQTAPKLETQKVEQYNLRQTVLTTGQVVSAVDLSLGFPTGGIVRRVFVKEGDRVKVGQTLATVDQVSASASLISARGAVAQAIANRDRVLSGSSNEAISVAQKAVDAAQGTFDNAQ
ncbi:biotin/lipoyl-binding protein, partial [Candidatus Uhrbacteria bacterium]|nr:biotin/lipoyl-binding protein [Candidatus Uhrbacteria bacterium]